MKNKTGYKIHEMSKISGVPAPNLRFYEMKGYPKPQRGENGYRQYCLEDVYRLNTFNMLIAQGFSVAEAMKRLEYHEAADYCAALAKNNQKIEEEIWLLKKKREWNRKMQYVYSHIEEELSISRRLMLPELVFLKCSENRNLQESYRQSEKIAKWVKLLPACFYAERRIRENTYELGMLTERSVAEVHGLIDETISVPAGEYLCMLTGASTGDSREEKLRIDPRLDKCRETDGHVSQIMYRIYLMVGEKDYGEFLNYIIVRL